MVERIGNIGALRHVDRFLIEAPMSSEEIFSGNYSATSSVGWQPNFSSIVKSWNVNGYVWTPINGVDDAIEKSQKHLIDLIRYYEGDPENNYKANPKYEDLDGKGTTTYGYGVTQLPAGLGVKLEPPKNESEAYNMMLTYLDKVAMEDIKATIGLEVYKKAPNSVKEALLDFAFKHGRSLLSNKKETLKAAINNEDWPTLLKTLVHAIPGAKNAEKVENSGLYRRSLSRVILATRDLENTPEIRKTIEEIYNKSIACAKAQNKPLKDFELIYQEYTKNNMLSESSVSLDENTKVKKFKVKNQISLYSVATALKSEDVSLKDLIVEIARLNNIKLGKADKNGFPIPVRTFEANEEIKLPTEFAGKKLKDLSLQGWSEVPEEVIEEVVTPEKETPKTPILENYILKEGEGYLKVQQYYYPEVTNYAECLKIANELELYNGIRNDSLRAGMVIKPLPQNPINNEESTIKEEENAVINESQEVPEDDSEKIENDKTSVQLIKELGYPDRTPLKNNLYLETYTYKVEAGYGFYAVAAKFGIDPKTLKEFNGLKEIPTELKLGQSIKIPLITYKVQKGDNFTKISEKFGIKKEHLADLNGIENIDKIKEGDYFTLPGYTYTVKSGDTLTNIAKKVGTTLKVLKEINGLTSDTIHPDQKLVILYNNVDYNVSPDKKQSVVIKNNEGKDETITVINADANLVGNRKYLKRRTNSSGKTIATREVFEPNNTQTDAPLKGKTIIVNAGHGYLPGYTSGIDEGCPGMGGLPAEYLMNYDNSMLLIEALREKGARVIFLQGKEGRDSRGLALISNELRKRENKADLFISLHINSADKPVSVDRIEVQHYRKSKSGARLANIMCKELEKNYDGTKYDSMKALSVPTGTQVLTTAASQNMPQVLWEVGFMPAKAGRERMKNLTLMKKEAEAVARSVVIYYKEMSMYKPHTVSRGENLGTIAQKYGTTINKLKEINGLTSDSINAGMILLVPKK